MVEWGLRVLDWLAIPLSGRVWWVMPIFGIYSICDGVMVLGIWVMLVGLMICVREEGEKP